MQTLPSVSLSLEDSEMVAKMSHDDLEDVSLSNDNEKGSNEERDEHSDSESVKDSVSTRGGAQTNGVKKVGSKSGGNNKLSKNVPLDSRARSIRERTEKIAGEKKQIKTSNSTPKKSARTNGGVTKVTPNTSPGRKSQNIKVHPKPSSESSEGTDDKSIGDVKDIDRLDEVQNGSQTTGSDNESADVEENAIDESQELVDQRLEEMELRIKTLEDELREIAALEISLYSVVPEHGNSAHKVHTPARRLSRLYIHACKQWSQAKRASIAKNTASGLVLVAKSCGNDVPRLTFWLSNTVVLREIISQAFGNSVQSSSITRMIETNGSMKKLGKPSSFKWKGSASSKRGDNGFTQFVDDWQETRTFTAALEKIESWIFSRIVESVWWQTLTPHMQSPAEDTYSSKGNGRVSGPSLGDQKQGCFSVNLWRSAFQDAFQKLCPVRAGGHECGCLPVLARMVMEQCVSRLDVAMFNAILRESAHDIPTDPVSDPIVDSKVLPIPAGDLSFGSGAQLKNSVGNWSRWLTDLFGMETDETSKDEINGEDDGTQETDVEPKSFPLLNELSDLLMLPKDMLIDRSIRKEVCPSIGLPLVLRILCNFTPDEFCPDPVPGAVLEALSSENFVLQRRISSNGESSSSFPHSAAPVVYSPPSPADVAAKVAYAEMKSQLERNVSIIQRKGYTSDEELDELESPLGSIFDKTPKFTGNENGGKKDKANCNGGNVRYDLLREVWKG